IFTNSGSGVNEYCTLEVRTGGNVGLFGRRHDGATEQRTSLINIDDDEWHHIAYYNSNSQNKWGLFVDGQQFEFTRSIAAYDHIVPVNDYPRNLESSSGKMQHIAYFPFKITPAQINRLLEL